MKILLSLPAKSVTGSHAVGRVGAETDQGLTLSRRGLSRAVLGHEAIDPRLDLSLDLAARRPEARVVEAVRVRGRRRRDDGKHWTPQALDDREEQGVLTDVTCVDRLFRHPGPVRRLVRADAVVALSRNASRAAQRIS